ncbi:MAG: transposase [Planctomycetes bacterium]|nr:transposase [Planctomycetota bacterium]
MARPLRIEYSGAYYHVINRGNAGENIFIDERDKEKFLEYLAKGVERFTTRIHTYCLMSNHYHLLLETPQANLSVAIQWLNVSYSVYFNKRHRRKGHLFQGRFKAVLLDANEYLILLSRYIHLNPVRAKMVTHPLEYSWSSYPVFTGKRRKPEWLITETILSYFGKEKKEATMNYKSYVEKVNMETLENPDKNMLGGFILGGAGFVDWVKDKFLSKKNKEKEIPQLKKLKPKVALTTIIQSVCDEFRCSEDQIKIKGRKDNKARAIAMYLARDLSGMSCKDMGIFFDGISGAAITMKYNQIKTELMRNKKLGDKIANLKKQLLNI